MAEKIFFGDSLRRFKKLAKQKLSLFISLFLLYTLHTLPSAFALEIPSEWGRIEENFQGQNGKTILLIQEAHVDYGAQKAIAEILRTLAEKDSLRLVLVEGGWDDMGLSYLRSYGSPEGRLEVAERYLREGKISAEEYLDIVSDFDLSLWGIEDPSLYRENMEAFLKIHAKQEKWLEELRGVETLLSKLKEKILPPPIAELEKRKQALEEKKITLLGYLQFAGKLAGDSKVSFEEFPRLRKLLAVIGMEGGIDPEKAEWEKQGLIRALTKKLTKPELERLELLKERKTPQEELEFLNSLLDFYKKHQKKAGLVSFPNLKRYAKALEEAASLQPLELFREIEQFEEKLRERNLLTSDQKRLAEITRRFGILKKLFELKLGPEEFAEFEKDPAAFQPSGWADFLKEKSKEFSVEPSLFPDLSEIEEAIPEAKAFYVSAEKREKALIENTVKKIQAEPDRLAALIVGGFHAERMAEALKGRGYSLVVVSPRFNPSDPKVQDRRYFEILKYKWGSGPSAVPAPTQQNLS